MSISANLSPRFFENNDLFPDELQAPNPKPDALNLEQAFHAYAVNGDFDELMNQLDNANDAVDDNASMDANDGLDRPEGGRNDRARNNFFKLVKGLFKDGRIPSSVVDVMKTEDYGGLSKAGEKSHQGSGPDEVSTRNKKLSQKRVGTVLNASYQALEKSSGDEAWQLIKDALNSGLDKEMIKNKIFVVLYQHIEDLKNGGRLENALDTDEPTLRSISDQLVSACELPESEAQPRPEGNGGAANAQGKKTATIVDTTAFFDAMERLDELISGFGFSEDATRHGWHSQIAQSAEAKLGSLSSVQRGQIQAKKLQRLMGKGDSKKIEKFLLGLFAKAFEEKLVGKRNELLNYASGVATLSLTIKDLTAAAEKMVAFPPNVTEAAALLRKCVDRCLAELPEGKERNHLRDRFDSFLFTAFPDVAEPGTGRLSAEQMKKLGVMAKYACGSGEGTAGGAGYMGIINDETVNAEVGKFLTHYGERSKNPANELTAEDIKRVNKATEALKREILDLAASCGLSDDVRNLLNAEIEEYTKKGAGSDVPKLQLLRRTTVAKIVALIAQKARNAETGVRFHFDSTLRPADTQNDTTIKTVFAKTQTGFDWNSTLSSLQWPRATQLSGDQLLQQIAGYARKGEGESAPKGYLGMANYGIPVEFLAHDNERTAFENGFGALDGNLTTYVNQSTEALRKALVGLAGEDVKGQVESLLTPATQRGLQLLSREKVAQAIELIQTDKGLNKADLAAFWRGVEPVGDFGDTSFEKATLLESLFNESDSGISLVKSERQRLKAEGMRDSLQQAEINGIIKLTEDEDYRRQAAQMPLKLKTTASLAPAQDVDIHRATAPCSDDAFEEETGTTTQVVEKVRQNHPNARIVVQDAADNTHPGGYYYTMVPSQEEPTIQDINPGLLAQLIAHGEVEIAKVDEEGAITEIKFTKKGLKRLSAANGFVVDTQMIGAGNKTQLTKPLPISLLFSAAFSFNLDGGSLDMYSVLDYAIKNHAHVLKDGVLTGANLSEEQKLKMLNNGLKFIGEYLKAVKTEIKGNSDYRWMVNDASERRKIGKVLMFSQLGEPPEFDMFAANTTDQVHKFLDLIKHKEGTAPNAKMAELYESAQKNYLETMRFSFKQWIDLAKQDGETCFVYTGVGAGAFGHKQTEIAECMIEMMVLHGGDMKFVYGKYVGSNADNPMSLVFKAAQAKYLALHKGLTDEQLNGMNLPSKTEAEAFLKLYSKYEDSRTKEKLEWKDWLELKPLWESLQPQVQQGAHVDVEAAFDDWWVDKRIKTFAEDTADNPTDENSVKEQESELRDQWNKWKLDNSNVQGDLSVKWHQFTRQFDRKNGDVQMANWLREHQAAFEKVEGVSDLVRNMWSVWCDARKQKDRLRWDDFAASAPAKAILDFLAGLPDVKAFDLDTEQGKSDCVRVCKRLANLFERSRTSTEPSERTELENRINLILEGVKAGYSNPLPFGEGEQTSYLTPEQLQPYLPVITPKADLLTGDEKDVLKDSSIFEDVGRGMGLRINGKVINAIGDFHAMQDETDLDARIKAAFTNESGVVDDVGFRLVKAFSNQRMFRPVTVGISTEGKSQIVLPTMLSHYSGDNDDPAVRGRPWGFDIKSEGDGNYSFVFTHCKRGMTLASVGTSTALDVTSKFNRPRQWAFDSNSGENYQDLTVTFTYHVDRQNNTIVPKIQEGRVVSKLAEPLSRQKLAAINEALVREVVAADDFNEIARNLAYEVDKEFNDEAFRTWWRANSADVISRLRDIDLGTEKANKVLAKWISLPKAVGKQFMHVMVYPKDRLKKIISGIYLDGIAESQVVKREKAIEQVRAENVRQYENRKHKSLKNLGKPLLTDEEYGEFQNRLQTMSLEKLEEVKKALEVNTVTSEEEYKDLRRVLLSPEAQPVNPSNG